ncbi:hypothetical protein [Halorubrum tibetense]|uniref:DUF8048 domain-containing protein n=1 Tax=Halorubrum tibetense TaxID=175631 RepID=A0ABD5S8Z9_9EURY
MSGEETDGTDATDGPAETDATDGPAETDTGDGHHPIDGTALVKTAALASVPADRLPALLARVQADLEPRIDEYRRGYERITGDTDREAFLVEPDHWTGIGERLGLSNRERDAAARAHETAVERWGSETGRREEFETALEIRSAVVIGTGPADE